MKSVCRFTVNIEQLVLSICRAADRQMDGCIREIGLGEMEQ